MIIIIYLTKKARFNRKGKKRGNREMCCTGVMKGLCDGNKNRIKRCCDDSECERLKDGFFE